MGAPLVPLGKAQWSDANGFPLVGGKVLFAVPGTSTPKNTWQDAAQTILNQNPITLDDRGEAIIFGTPGAYRQIVTDQSGNLIYDVLTYCGLDASSVAFDGQTLAEQFRLGLNRVVDSVSDLRSVQGVVYSRVFVTGYYSPHDGGGGPYQLDPSDTVSADDGGSVIVALDGSRWKLQFSGALSADQFGAKADKTTDDTSCYQNMFAALNKRGGGVATTSIKGQSLIAGNLEVLANVTFNGGREGTGTPGDNTSAPYDMVNGALIVNSGSTITIDSNASLSGMLIYRQGMTFPAADASAFAGTAITINGNDVAVSRVQILGFGRAIYSNGFYRQRFEYIYGDNTNGIEITKCPDVPHIDNCHMWPFATIAESNETGSYTVLERSGTAYSIHDDVDGAMLRNCFAYGYQRGFLVSNASSTTFINCWADGTFGPGVLNTGNIAFQIVGNSKDTRLIGWQGSAQDVAAIQVNTNTGCLTTISGGNAWYCNQDLISVISGDVIIVGNGLRNCNNGITFYGASSNATVCENTFYALSGEPINTSVPTASISVGKNYYPDLPAGQPPIGNQLIVGGATLSGSVLNLPATIPQNVLNLYSGGSMGTMNGGYAGRTESICFQSSTTVIHTPWSSSAAQNSIVCKSGANTVKAPGTVTEYTFMGLQWVEK